MLSGNSGSQPASALLQDWEFILCDPSLQAPGRPGNYPEGIGSLGVERNARKNGAAEPLGGGNLKSFADLTQPPGSAYASAF